AGHSRIRGNFGGAKAARAQGRAEGDPTQDGVAPTATGDFAARGGVGRAASFPWATGDGSRTARCLELKCRDAVEPILLRPDKEKAMMNTVVGLLESRSEAESVVHDLEREGIGRDHIRVMTSDVEYERELGKTRGAEKESGLRFVLSKLGLLEQRREE